MLKNISPTQYRTLIEQYAHQLEYFLAIKSRTKAQSLLKSIQANHDTGEDLDYVISVICEVLDNVLNEKAQPFPRTLPPKGIVSHDEKDHLMSELLEMKMIWISDLENFNERIRCHGALENYTKVKGTTAYTLYQAMLKRDKEKALPLIELYFASFQDEKLKIEIASRMLEHLLIKWYPTSSNSINKVQAISQREILQALLTQGAQISNQKLLNPFDKDESLAKLVGKNRENTKYIYRVG